LSNDGDEGDEESEGQDDYSYQSNDHFDNSNPNPHYFAEKGMNTWNRRQKTSIRRMNMKM
jgi:hypothetical protein